VRFSNQPPGCGAARAGFAPDDLGGSQPRPRAVRAIHRGRISKPLEEVVASPYVAEPLVGLLERHHKNVKRSAAWPVLNRVVFHRLSLEPITSVNKSSSTTSSEAAMR